MGSGRRKAPSLNTPPLIVVSRLLARTAVSRIRANTMYRKIYVFFIVQFATAVAYEG